MKANAWLAVVLSVVLGGCASGFPGARPLSYATPGESRIYVTGQRCAHEPTGTEAAPLVVATLTAAASTLLKNFGTALAEGAKGGALPASTAIKNLQLNPGTVPKCIVLVRGSFQPTSENSSEIDDLAKFLGLSKKDADGRNRLEALKIPPLYRVDYFIEVKMSASKNNKALTFAPVFVKIDRSIDGSKKGERDLSIAVKINRVGAEPVGSVVVLADRRIGSAEKFEPQADGRFELEAPWFGTFHAPPTPAGADDKNKVASGSGAAGGGTVGTAVPASGGAVGGGGAGAGGGGSGAATLPPSTPGSGIPSMQSASPDSVPVTVTATVVETRPTNQGLAFVASVFGAVTPKIEEAIKPLLDRDAKQAADDAETSAALGSQADYASAEGTARAALISYCRLASTAGDAAGNQDRVTKSTTARSAQLKANVAAIKADVIQPFTNLVVISDGLPTNVNTVPCTGI